MPSSPSPSLPPPLTGIRVLELAGLAPGPYAGLLLADYGASVLRIDRAHPSSHSSTPPPPTPDNLTRRKSSIAIDLKSPSGRAFLLSLIPHADILIDPFRPGVLESLGLAPSELEKINPRLITARMTGFRRDGKYSAMAGHDINYLSVSGVLSLLGRKGEAPYAPGNLLGDFAGGGLVLFSGILLALTQRAVTGRGQVVEANMVDGAAHLASFPRLALKTPMWDRERGENVLDGGCPWYDTYSTKDEGEYMAVGALEPQFFAALVKGLGLDKSWNVRRMDRGTWGALRREMEEKFRSRTRREWEEVFDGTDACCTPVLGHKELEKGGYDQRPIVTLRESPGLAVATAVEDNRDAAQGQGKGVDGSGWKARGLAPGHGGEEVLQNWTGWQKGKEYDVVKGGLVLADDRRKAKL
ncbi:CoA-transferase family III [Myriangium duriaei CBS 260.36]|uniref:CoA-transferase family III n=1 Tax=Myriangium duriaei CBS 260.36 TaxID=1168546 RepID=A0A9P4MNA3_9PEZI|nr:CoA-transferase family III [Myriangium duriaei CBS 260.36]